MRIFELTFVWLFLLMIAILGSSGGLIYYVCTAHNIGVSVGDPCPSRPGFPPSTCAKFEFCETLKAYKNISDKVEGCGFYLPYGKELICCPDKMPSPNTATTIQPEATTQKPKLYYNYLGSMGYLEPIRMDDYEYRYTAIILSPSHVLATKLSNISKPLKVMLGTGDPRKAVDTEVELYTKATRGIEKDLILYELEEPISESQLRTNISIAKLCDSGDLLNSTIMNAIGFARDRTLGTNCAVFKQRVHLVDFNKCPALQDIPEPNAHLCVTPGVDDATPGKDDLCSKCLTASSSVLQVERPDGSFCVGGIATPTTNECVVTGDPIYYTILLASKFSKLIAPGLPA
ncbi:hypothetical protein ACLKA6_013348 [Drosophila palustris]